MNTFRISHSTLLILLAGFILAGDYLGLPWISLIFLIALSLAAIIGSIRIFNQGEIGEGIFSLSSLRFGQRYRSLSAWVYGLLLGLSGLLILALSLIELFNPGGASIFISDLLDSSFGLGILFGVSGLLLTAFGVLRFLSGSPNTSGLRGALAGYGIKAGGVFTTIIGILFLVLAIGSLLSPGFLQELLELALRFASKIIQ
ncbi:MAG: hypothetical protein JSV61_12515 [Anaerolineales bacterium]|nr:MAG: hypothetical protein JSV61_12515 [Anaerolineales bacterium]